MLNTEQNKVTWVDTLHPSEGHAALSKQEQEYGGKWGAVWAEAVLIDDAEGESPEEVVGTAEENPTSTPADTMSPEREEHSSCHSFNPILHIFGWSMLVMAVATTFAMELMSCIVFLLATGFHWVSEQFGQWGGLFVFFQTVFGIVAQTLSFVDTVLLMMGTIVTELLAWVTFGLCFLFGGLCAASEWHQSVRRLCHLTRWAFRGFHQDWSYQRGPGFLTKDEAQGTDKPKQTEDNTTVVLGDEDVVVIDSNGDPENGLGDKTKAASSKAKKATA